MASDPDVDRLVKIFRDYTFLAVGESLLQASICTMFNHEGVEYEREVRLNERDRIDFLVGDIGLEVKVAGSWREVRRQLQRYAESPRIRALLVVTTRTIHTRLPTLIHDTPVHVHVLRNAGM